MPVCDTVIYCAQKLKTVVAGSSTKETQIENLRLISLQTGLAGLHCNTDLFILPVCYFQPEGSLIAIHQVCLTCFSAWLSASEVLE